MLPERIDNVKPACQSAIIALGVGAAAHVTARAELGN
jgi:hypothetical protein